MSGPCRGCQYMDCSNCSKTAYVNLLISKASRQPSLNIQGSLQWLSEHFNSQISLTVLAWLWPSHHTLWVRVLNLVMKTSTNWYVLLLQTWGYIAIVIISKPELSAWKPKHESQTQNKFVVLSLDNGSVEERRPYFAHTEARYPNMDLMSTPVPTSISLAPTKLF